MGSPAINKLESVQRHSAHKNLVSILASLQVQFMVLILSVTLYLSKNNLPYIMGALICHFP